MCIFLHLLLLQVKFTSEVPECIVKWAACCQDWKEEMERGNSNPDRASNVLITGEGVKAFLVNTDTKLLTSDDVQGVCGRMPAFRQCIIDKPEVCSNNEKKLLDNNSHLLDLVQVLFMVLGLV